MINSRRKRSSQSDLLNSSLVMNMMREFSMYHRSQPNSTRPVLGPINFDESSTEEICPVSASKTRIIDRTPTKSEVSSHSSSLVTELRHKLVEKDMELQHAKATISSLKAAAGNLEPEAKESRIEFEKQMELKNMESDSLKEKLLRLTNHIQLLEEQEASSQANQKEERETLKLECSKLSQRLKTAQAQRDDLECQLERIKIDSSSTTKLLQNEVMRLKLELRLINDEKTQQEEQHKHIVKQMQEKVVEETLRVKSELDSKISELELELKKRSNNEQAVNAMMEDMKRLVFLEKECSRLREDNEALHQNKENTFLLKEKLLSLQEELSRTQGLLEKSRQLELENYDLHSRLAKWETVASSPGAASNFISQLQKSEISLVDQSGKLKSELLCAKTNIIDLEKKVAALQSEVKQSKDIQGVASSNMKKLRRKLLLLSKECESYKSIISSYESEVTVSLSHVQDNKVAMLERLVEDYKETLSNYESQMNSTPEKVQYKEESENEKLLNLEVQKLKQQVHNLEKQVEAYESLKGPSRQGKVYHFHKNPVTIAQQQRELDVKTVREENERLRARLQVLEAGKVGDVTAEANQLLLEQRGETVQSLREQVSSAEQKNKRMMEAFKKTSQEFREVVYLLTGFKIDMSNQNRYKVSHMYSESQHDFLLFEQSSDGEVHLLETDYSKSIGHLIEDHLIKQQSIPLFLSNITMELFFRQTSVLNS